VDDLRTDDWFGVTDALDALAALESNTNAAILAQRASQRLEIQTKLLVRPGNASQRHEFGIPGVTADISSGGCMVLLPRPIMTGDIFWLSFDDSVLRLGSLLARCLRCRLVREDAFEVGFRFLNDVDLHAAIVNDRVATR
jgi:hypothetical protein